MEKKKNYYISEFPNTELPRAYLEPLQERLPRDEIVDVQRIDRVVNLQNRQRVKRGEAHAQDVGDLFERAGGREPQVKVQLIDLRQRDGQHLEALRLGHQVAPLDQVQRQFGEQERPVAAGLQVLAELHLSRGAGDQVVLNAGAVSNSKTDVVHHVFYHIFFVRRVDVHAAEKTRTV